MRKLRAKQSEEIYLIKTTLSDLYDRAGEQPYRVLPIPEEFTLYSLAGAILDSFDFDFDHAFGFYDNIRGWTDSVEGYELFADIGEESKFKGVEKTKIKEAFDKLRKKMLFLFDYGHEWHFLIELKAVESPKAGDKYPLVKESVGDAPSQYGGVRRRR